MQDLQGFFYVFSCLSLLFHGKDVTFILSNDDDYYYTGRATINQWECVKRKGTIVITIDCDPYKYAVTETVRMVTLNNQTKVITLINNRKRVCPVITVTGEITLKSDDFTYELSEGTQQIINFKLVEGNNNVEVSGNGTINIKYRQGAL